MTGVYQDVPELVVSIAPHRLTPDLVTLSLIRGSVRDRYLVALSLLLAHVGAGRVRKCPTCHRAFLKAGRRVYCQRPDCERSRNAACFAHYKTTPTGQRVIRKARRKQYRKYGCRLRAAKAVALITSGRPKAPSSCSRRTAP